MNKNVLIESLQNDDRSSEICSEVVDASFELLASMVSVDQSLSIDEIGTFGAHYRKGKNIELPNDEGRLAQKNLSIFFHPSAKIKASVQELVEDDKTD